MLHLILATILAQTPLVELPKELTVRSGRLLKIESKSAAKTVKWVNTSDDADLIVSESGRWAIFSSNVAGTYKIFAWTAQGDMPSEAAICTIIVGGGIPPPPEPASPLRAALQAIYGADGDPKKSDYKTTLIALYTELAKASSDESLVSVGDFYSLAKRSANSVLPVDALPAIREKIANEFGKVFPEDPKAKLTPEIRSVFASQFSSMSQLLGEIK
jgi:hypothetical protein